MQPSKVNTSSDVMFDIRAKLDHRLEPCAPGELLGSLESSLEALSKKSSSPIGTSVAKLLRSLHKGTAVPKDAGTVANQYGLASAARVCSGNLDCNCTVCKQCCIHRTPSSACP